MFSLTLSCCGILLLATLTPTLCCDWLSHYQHLNGDSMDQLELMGGAVSMKNSPVPFPYTMYDRMESAKVETQLAFLRDNLEMILALYRHDNVSSAPWDMVRTEHFMITIQRQIDEISSCVSHNLRTDCGLRRYYNKLRRRTLDRNGGSVACWEVIRVETKLHLIHMELLVNRMLGASSRGRHTELVYSTVPTTAPTDTSALC